jgi:hypothetical protein
LSDVSQKHWREPLAAQIAARSDPPGYAARARLKLREAFGLAEVAFPMRPIAITLDDLGLIKR